MKEYKIFAINPGSTSTKVAYFKNEKQIFSANVKHDFAKLSEFPDISSQMPYRKQKIEDILKENHISLQGTDAFVGRGGGVMALEGGTYDINETVLRHARTGTNGIQHPAQLGSQLAESFRQEFGGRGFIVNPPDVDEFSDVARVTGIKDIFRGSHIHALNQKETAIRHARIIGKRYEECRFVVCHIGGGISIAAHKYGKMVDGTDIVGGEGPLAPTRAGALPAAPLIRLCFSGKYNQEELLEKLTRNGGMVDHLGTSDAVEVFNRAKSGDKHAQLVWNAMIYQIVKAIGSMAAVLKGKVDGILLGGGMVHNEELVHKITEVCSFIAPVTAYPGEFEMEAMAYGALRVLTGEEEPKEYTGVPIFTGFDFQTGVKK